MIRKSIYFLFCLVLVIACKIENDIPYPIVDGSILDIEVEGQCAPEGSSNKQAIIDKNARTVKLYIDDSVDLSKLRITKLTVSNDATLLVSPSICHNYEKFPTAGFSSLDDLPVSSDTYLNFSSPVTITLHTYQDYDWKINVEQLIERNIVLENQIGNAIIDDINHNVVVYVSDKQPLNKIKVTSFELGGKSGTVYPDPTADAYFDFSEPRSFFVSHGWEEVSHQWMVYVYQTDESASSKIDIFPMTTSAIMKGSIQSGKQPVIEYREVSASNWLTQTSGNIEIDGTNYTTRLQQLNPATDYECRVSIDGTIAGTQSFSTTSATPLTDGSFDNWHQVDKLWNPWASGSDSFWDTGNKGAVTVGQSNSIPTDETCNGSGKAASLESKFIVLKFAAGNIFTGSYLKTIGTNGVLSFGQPFTAFPSKLRINYKYTSATIDKVGEDDLAYLKGRPDSCHIYVALTDWDEPREIRTRPSERQLFDKNDSKIIAYAELVQGVSDAVYQQKDLILNYRYSNRTPRYIVVVATASKYGDYFTGGVGSKLLIDNFELIYE